ncbi:ABC transporter permease [Clostridium sp. 'White wine YQ']|nr:ABC transporter permease [Clostridium sp. 'White wine YQ']
MIFILIILQLSFGLYMVTSASSIVIDKKVKENNFANLFNYKNTFVIKQAANKNGQESKEYFKHYRELSNLETTFDNLKDNGTIRNAKVFFTFPLKIDGLDQKANEKYWKLNLQGQYKQFYQYTSKILVNNDFINSYSIKMKEGRGLKASDFNVDYTHEEIPILIGLDYKDKVHIGDTFHNSAYIYDASSFNGGIKQVNVTFKVVGIMDKHSIPSLLAKSNFIENVVYSDSLVVIPTVKGVDDFSTGLSINDLGIFVEMYDNSKVSLVEDTINNNLKNTGLYVSSYSLKKDYEGIKSNLQSDLKNSLFLGITVTLISVIGIISIIIGELHRRKKEFGIRICLGATVSNLCKEVFMEIGLISISSMILSYVFLYIKTDIKTIISTFNIIQLLVNILIICILTIIISIEPILIIRKMEPVELLKSK